MPIATPQSPLYEHVTFPWWSMVIALPFILALVVLGPTHFPGPMGSTLALAGAGLAAFLGLHAPVPASLKSRPWVAKLIFFASSGGVAKLLFFLPLVTEPHLQSYLWLAIALLSWLAGMPLTVGVSGAALPAQLLEPRGLGDVRILGALAIGILAGLGGAAWAFGAHWLGGTLLVLAICAAGANALALIALSRDPGSASRVEDSP